MYTYTNRVKHFVFIIENLQFPFFLFGKDSACNVEDLGSIPGLGRSPGEGDGYLLQYSFLENSMDRGAWRATVHGITKSQTRLSDWTGLKLFMVAYS